MHTKDSYDTEPVERNETSWRWGITEPISDGYHIYEHLVYEIFNKY